MNQAEGIHNFRSIKSLGSGTFGDVFHVMEAFNDKNIALKAVNWEDLSDSKKTTAITEVEVLCRLKHTGIVGYKGCFSTDDNVRKTLGFKRSETPPEHKLELSDGDQAKTRPLKASGENDSTLCVLMEYIDAGDLNELIDTTRTNKDSLGFSEEAMWKYVVQLASAIGMLHSQKILHRDLKPMNVLVTKEGDLVVADLGIASDNILNKQNQANTHIGTPRYQSPEMFKAKTYDAACDVWAMGVILYELMALKNPWTHATNFLGLVNTVCNEEAMDLDYCCRRDYSSALKGLVSWMMMKKPSARPTSTEIWAYISKQVDGVLLNKYTSNNTVPWTPFELKNAEAEIFALEGYKKLEQYKGIKTIASTGLVSIYEVEHVETKKRYALKAVIWEPLDPTQRTLLIDEVMTSKDVKHAHLSAYKAHFKHRGDVKQQLGFGASSSKYLPKDPEDPFKFLCVIMPLAASSLDTVIGTGNPIKEADIWRYLLQSITALERVHTAQSKPYLSLTPACMRLDGKGNVALQTVSMQRTSCTYDIMSCHANQFRYMAPEVVESKPCDIKADTWSLGCIAYEMAVLDQAFKGDATNELVDKITKLDNYPMLDENNDIMSPELRTCIKWMLQQNPAHRPSMQELYLYMVQLDHSLTADYKLKDESHKFSPDVACIPGGYKRPCEKLLAWPKSPKTAGGGRYLSGSNSSSGGAISPAAQCIRDLQRRPTSGSNRATGLPSTKAKARSHASWQF